MIHRESQYDIETGRLLCYVADVEECREWALCKGENQAGMAASQQQLAMQNQLTQQQLAMAQKFQQPVLAGLSQYLTGDVGFTPEQKALLTSQFLNENTQKFNQAGMQVRSALASRGAGAGDLPVGGDYVRGIATLEGLKGATTAAGLRDINLADIQQALTNKFNTAGIFTGNSGINVGGAGAFQNAASASLGDYVKASTPQPSPWYGVLGAALGAGGAALSGGGTAALTAACCPSVNALVKMADGSERRAGDLRAGDEVLSIDGGMDRVVSVEVFQADMVSVMFGGNSALVKHNHTFALPSGGYCFAEACEGMELKTYGGRDKVEHVVGSPAGDVVDIRLDRTHSYCADGIWSLE